MYSDESFRAYKNSETFKVVSFGTRLETGLGEPLAVVRSTREFAEETYAKFASDRFKPETVALLVNGWPVKAVGPKADALMAIAESKRAKRAAA
jgi:hypothetical protein